MALYNLGNKEVVIDNMALYNLGKKEVVIDNMALYNLGKKEDDTDSVNPYEDINEGTRNCENTATPKSQQTETPVYSKAHANKAGIHETAKGANADHTYSVVVKVEKPAAAGAIYSKAAAGAIYSKASSIRAKNLAYENVSVERL